MRWVDWEYSVRAYKPDPVEDGKLQQVLEAARLAPTAANRQPFQLIVMHTAVRKAELRRIYGRDWFVQALLIICACGIPASRGGNSSRSGLRLSLIVTLSRTDLRKVASVGYNRRRLPTKTTAVD